MATLEREEGDYTYWSDGATRYAGGNSQGKQKGSLAKRPPYAATRLDKLPPRKLKEIQSSGGKANYARKKVLVAEAYALALKESHPDSVTEEEGMLMIAEAEFIQATDGEGGGPAVKAREHFIQEYTGGKQQPTVDARQQHVHLTISPGPAAEQKRLMADLMEVVEGETRELDDDEG